MILRTMFGPVVNYAADVGGSEPLSARQALGIMGDMNEAASEPADKTQADKAPLGRRENPAIAARQVIEEKRAEAKESESATEPDEGEGAAEQELADEADATPPEAEPGSDETEGTEEPAEGPPIDPPRSWTKEEKLAFALLPREHQQNIAERERTRELDIRRGQNEAADIRRAAEAERQAAEQARQQYENALPTLLQTIQSQMAGEFSDVKSWEDVKRMADEDFPRYLRYDAMTKQAQAVEQEVRSAQVRQQQDQSSRFAAFVESENKKFLEILPQYNDPKQAPQLQANVRAVFDDVGVGKPELEALWSGQSGISLRDHRVQLILHKAALYDAAQKAVKKSPAKPAAPVQRPGSPPSRGESKRADIEKLDQRLTKSGSRKDALALMRGLSAR